MTRKLPARLMRKSLLAVSLALAAGAVAAQPHSGYVNSSSGIVKSGFGLCWHTSAWTPEKAVEPCDAVPKAAVSPPAPAPMPQPKLAVQPAPAPAPSKPLAQAPAEPPPPAPVIRRVALDTRLLFDFDSAELRPEGRARLDEIALKLHGASIESIAATGHADRIASASYNQELSEERAAAVARYLAELGFDGRRIRAEGRGESQPVTGARCNAMGAEHGDNLKLVRCLQPDRRVELEVRGTR